MLFYFKFLSLKNNKMGIAIPITKFKTILKGITVFKKN